MKFWTKPPTRVEIESQQESLRNLSGDLLERYRKELYAEISDPRRLTATYGKAFATADSRRQAEVVAKMASQMLSVPNAEVNIIDDHQQLNIAAVHDCEIVYSKPALELEESFCKNVIGTGREMSIEDAREHPLVCDTKIVTQGLVVSYLGVPVANRGGIIIGVLCVFESAKRDWRPADVAMLTQLSMVLTRSLT